jgi:hypothetical protein
MREKEKDYAENGTDMNKFLITFTERDGESHTPDWAKISSGLETWKPQRHGEDETETFLVLADDIDQAERAVTEAVGHRRFKVREPRHDGEATRAEKSLKEYHRGPLWKEAEALRELLERSAGNLASLSERS